jgi:DNA polymerase (family 10)
MQNSDIARIFDELGDLLELDGANSFRVRAYRNASRTLEELSEPVAEMARDRAKLQELEGIGKDLAEKIVVIVETGSLPQLEQLREKIPVGVLQMMKISGVGPKKAAALFKELNIRNLEELRVAAEGDQISGLKGFGKKTQQAILEGLEHVESAGLRVLLPEAKAQADAIVDALSALESIVNVSAAGSVRRRRETVADLDVLAACAEPGPPMDLLAAHPLVEKVLSRGDTKMRVRLRSRMELDLRVVPENSYGAALQYFTGSKEHNIIVRRRAQERGLKVNEYGVFRGEDQIAGRTEDDVYAAIDLPWFPPELREGRSEFERADQGKLPRLIELADIQGDLHMHTTATDGHASIREMAEAAKARGLKYIAITDHSKRVTMANGLTAERLREHWKEIEKVRKQVAGIEILKGIECDILEGGALDLPDDVLAEADWVIAVLHYGLKQPQEEIHMRLLNAIRSPHVSIIGHPTARIVGGRPPVAVDMDVILKAAAEHGVMMEINADPHRLDLNDIHAAAARDRGIPIVISTDSHNVRGFEVLEYGIYQARRAGLEAKDVANTRSFAEFKKLLRR